MKKNNIKHYIILACTFLLVLVLDQVSKALLTGKNIVLIKNFFELTYAQNTGAAFSMLSGARWFFIPLTVILVAVIIYIFFANKNKTILFSLSVGLICGGAIGNLIDRIVFGYVKDFINFSFFPAIFNIADSAITIGSILLVIYIIFFAKKEEKSEQ